MQRPSRQDVLGDWSITQWSWALLGIVLYCLAALAVVVYLIPPE